MSKSSYSDIDALPTPALVIDLPTVECNLQRMASYCQQHNLNLRPHTKTHKSIAMAKRQLASGACGLTVAKTGEARVMSQAGNDILIGYPAFDKGRCGAVIELAKANTIRVALDTEMAARQLSQAAKAGGVTLGVLVDIDTGFARTGVQSFQAATALAQTIDSLDGLRFDGLFTFPGHISANSANLDNELKNVSDIFKRTIDALKVGGLKVKIVSGGSTPTALHSHQIPELTEIRPGTYIYNDWNCVAGGCASERDCAAKIICTVVSDAVAGKVVIDAGSKTLTSDRLGPDPDNGGYGHVVQYPKAKITRLSEEHGEINFYDKYDKLPAVGSRLTIIPNHICPCVNLQNHYYLRQADGSMTKQPVDARGLVV